MATHEKTFGNLMLGLILGVLIWAATGSLFGMFFRDDLYLIGHTGIRSEMYTGGDQPY